ncbi:MAG: hypothetical protein ACOYM3_18520, partial [Terrimicrobiaceae bacterium]
LDGAARILPVCDQSIGKANRTLVAKGLFRDLALSSGKSRLGKCAFLVGGNYGRAQRETGHSQHQCSIETHQGAASICQAPQ